MWWYAMRDLAHELRQAAESAALEARPLPAPEVMRKGDRRRRRRRSRNIVAGFLTAGAVVAAITVLAGTSSPVQRGRVQPAMPGACTERATLSVARGQLAGCVSYRYVSRGFVQVRGLEAFFRSAYGYALPYFTFAFRDPTTGRVDYQFATKAVEANAAQSHDTGRITLAEHAGVRRLPADDLLEITLHAYKTQGVAPVYYTVATLVVSLNQRGLRCPENGRGVTWGSADPRRVRTC
jgi:hypothetical protein